MDDTQIKPTHTPGPWLFDCGCFYAQCQLDENGMTSERPIAELLDGRQEDYTSNGRLIAAAPELLAAAVQACNAYLNNGGVGIVDFRAMQDAISKALTGDLRENE